VISQNGENTKFEGAFGGEIGSAVPENPSSFVSQNGMAKSPADLSQKEQLRNYSEKP